LKNLSLILNGILFVAVGILFYLHFACSKSSCNAPASQISSLKTSKPVAIAYVNSDSLLKKYAFYIKMKAGFEMKQSTLERDLVSREQALRAEAASYQQKAQTMTENELRSLQETFAKKEQDLLQYKDKNVRILSEEQQKQNEILYNKVSDYLKANCKNKFKYVLGYSKDWNLLYAEDSLNITNQVIEGLNKEFKEQEKKNP
jgi:outer membrane protein